MLPIRSFWIHSLEVLMSYQMPNNPQGNARIRKIMLIIFSCLCVLSIPIIFFAYQTSKALDDFYFGTRSNAVNSSWQILSIGSLGSLALAAFFWSRSIKKQWQESKRKYNLILFLQLVSLSCMTLSIWNLLYLFIYVL